MVKPLWSGQSRIHHHALIFYSMSKHHTPLMNLYEITVLKKHSFTLLLSILLMSFSRLVCSDVSISISDSTEAILISGVIKNGDESKFLKYASEFTESDRENGKSLIIFLNSRGGSVDTAISIGKQIRELQNKQNLSFPPIVSVPFEAECTSSCVLVLAGGLARLVAGQVGIHRPILVDDPNLSLVQQKKVYERIENDIKKYLELVNVPVSLYDTMFRIPAEEVHYLTKREMQDFGLNKIDPYFEEALNAKQAKEYNISKLDYTTYRREVKEKCRHFLTDSSLKSFENYQECEDRTKEKYGIK